MAKPLAQLCARRSLNFFMIIERALLGPSSRVDVDFADRQIDDASGLIVRKERHWRSMHR